MEKIDGLTRTETQGARLYLIDGVNAEDAAMLQALYSRSPESVEVHWKKVRERGSGKFMSTYYVGFNHKSIGDCGSTYLFFEDVSLLAAKAIQDWPLYSGIETSTRYLDMGARRIVDPVGSERSGDVLHWWMEFYRVHQDAVARETRRRYPRRAGEDEAVYEKAVKARTFDVMRGFLPAGVTTQLSWHTNLRQAADHLALLVRHPADEVMRLGVNARHLLAHEYPSSYPELREDTAWEDACARAWTYVEPDENADLHDWAAGPGGPDRVEVTTTIRGDRMWPYEALLRERPKGGLLPHFLTDLGQVSLRYDLDFGSFRDVQRHRNGVCRMPLLTTDLGFEPWYLEQLPEDVRALAEQLIAAQTERIARVSRDPVERQYYTALGYRVPVRTTYGLPATTYVLETRTSKMVHPTLRRRMLAASAEFFRLFPGAALHVDRDPDDWSVRRGAQDIVERSGA